MSSSSKTSKGPMGAPPRLRLLFEVRSRDGTPCSSLVRLGRQNNYLHCCGSGFCGRIGVGFPSSQRSTTSTYAIIDFPASNSWVELSAVLQCACSAAVDMTPKTPVIRTTRTLIEHQSLPDLLLRSENCGLLSESTRTFRKASDTLALLVSIHSRGNVFPQRHEFVQKIGQWLGEQALSNGIRVSVSVYFVLLSSVCSAPRTKNH